MRFASFFKVFAIVRANIKLLGEKFRFTPGTCGSLQINMDFMNKIEAYNLTLSLAFSSSE